MRLACNCNMYTGQWHTMCTTWAVAAGASLPLLCRLLTCAFLHDSFSHLAVNTYALYTVAPQVEKVLGYWTFSSVYLLTGLAGSSAAYIFGDAITVGASNCLFGLIGMQQHPSGIVCHSLLATGRHLRCVSLSSFPCWRSGNLFIVRFQKCKV